MNLAKFFIENNKFTMVLTAFVVLFGIGGLRSINSESYPAVAFAVATITTVYDGASPEDIETLITKPIEDEIRTISGIKDVRSVSQAGLSKITVRLDIDNIDVDEVMADLQRTIDGVTDLPADLQEDPQFLEIKSEEFPVIELAVIGPNDNRKRDLIADELKEEIEDNKNVLSIRMDGFRKRQFNIYLDDQKMKLHHIGVDEVINKLTARNVNIPGGYLEEGADQQLLRIESKVHSDQELGGVLIRSNFSGNKILLKDIASIKDSEEDARFLARHNGQPATLLIINKKSGADTIAMVKDIDKKIDRFQEKYKDYQFEIFNNESRRVIDKLDVLMSNALTGLVLVIFFLMLFLPGRIGFMASLSLPLSVFATIGFMPIFDMNLNTITILALVISLGMMVDNSVVISENYSRLRREGRTRKKAATDSISQLWLPITATALTTIAAFLPMLVTKGIMGQFIKFIPIIVCISLTVSLLESFFFLPIRLVTDKRRSDNNNKLDFFDRRVIPSFSRFLGKAIRFRYVGLGVFTLIIIGSIMVMTVWNKFILFPAEQVEIYVGRVEFNRGTRIQTTHEVLEKLSHQIKQTGGEHMKHVVARAGTMQTEPTDPKSKEGDNVGLIMMYMDKVGADTIDHTQLLKRLRDIERPQGVIDLTFDAMINGPPVGDPINATFRSNNNESLTKVTQHIVEEMNKIEGVRDVRIDEVVGENEIFVDIDYDKADRLGLDVNAIGATIRAAVSGKVVSHVNLNNKEVDLVVRMRGEYRKNLKDLSQLEVMDRQGHLIPIGSVATFRNEDGSPQIKRFDYKRSKTITGDLNDEQITAVEANAKLAEIFSQVESQYKDVSLIFGGEQENTNESMQSLFNALILSLIGIFALLVFLFNSYIRPVIIMSTIPLGLVGFSVAFALEGRPVSFMALIGIIGLGGIIVNAGIVLISFIEQLKVENNDASLHEILVKASSLRLRAVVVSSLTTVSGLLPTAYGIGGSDAMLIPMTLSMAWGLTSGTLLTLVWVPCFYAILEDITELTRRLLGRSEQPSFVAVNENGASMATREANL